MEASVQDLAKVFQTEAFVSGVIRNADPGDVTLTNMLDAGSTIDKVVYLDAARSIHRLFRRRA